MSKYDERAVERAQEAFLRSSARRRVRPAVVIERGPHAATTPMPRFDEYEAAEEWISEMRRAR